MNFELGFGLATLLITLLIWVALLISKLHGAGLIAGMDGLALIGSIIWIKIGIIKGR